MVFMVFMGDGVFELKAAIGPCVTSFERGVIHGMQAQMSPMQHSTIVQSSISVLNPARRSVNLVQTPALLNLQVESEELSTAKTK